MRGWPGAGGVKGHPGARVSPGVGWGGLEEGGGTVQTVIPGLFLLAVVLGLGPHVELVVLVTPSPPLVDTWGGLLLRLTLVTMATVCTKSKFGQVQIKVASSLRESFVFFL